jgi:nucleoid-associated protein YgaU
MIVGLATVALYRPEPPGGVAPDSAPAKPANPLVHAPPEPTAVPIPEPTPGVAWAEPPPSPRRKPSGAVPATTAGGPREAGLPARRPRFLTAGPDETLADVARRVYGTPEAAEALWMANRDQVASRDAPLRPGVPLRAPEALGIGGNGPP